MTKLVIPKFATETEEAQWWDDHKDVVEENLMEALRSGTAQHGTALRLVREARAREAERLAAQTSDPESRKNPK
jgi:hypothetical protein